MDKLKQYLNYGYFFNDSQEFGNYKLYLVFFGILIVAAFALRILAPKFIERKDPRKPLVIQIFWVTVSLSSLGLLFVFFRLQDLPMLSKRFFLIFDLSIIFIYALTVLLYYKKKVPQKLWNFQNKKRKEKWLPAKKR